MPQGQGPSPLERLAALKKQRHYAGSFGDIKERRASRKALEGKIAEMEKSAKKPSGQDRMRSRMKTLRSLAEES